MAASAPGQGVNLPPPPGWYRDPFERLLYRWWDGTAWSAYGAGTSVQWDPIPFDDEIRVHAPGLRAVGVATAGFVGGVVLAVVIQLALAAASYPGGRAALLLCSELGLWSGLVAACLYVSKRRGTGRLADDFGFRFLPVDLAFGLAGSFAARITQTIAILPVVAAVPHLKSPDKSVFGGTARGTIGWLEIVVLVCVGAPLIEELFFRGLVQTRLVGRFGSVAGITVTSMLFGAAHLIGWQGVISLVLALGIAGGGIVLGMLRHLTGRLGPSIVAHSLFNAQALILLAFFS